VSDFLEDDGQYRFVSDRPSANSSLARVLAPRVRANHTFSLQGACLCLGRLESTDYAALSPRRKAAIEAVWKAYFEEHEHAPDIYDIYMDGPGMLAGMDNACFNKQGDATVLKGSDQ
jgi:hypothetical protein